MNSVKDLRKTITQIKEIITILDSKQIYGLENRENYFFDNHLDIMNAYPFLVSQLCSGNNTDMLDIMLNQVELIEKGKKTSEEADIDIGQKLADKFMKQ